MASTSLSRVFGTSTDEKKWTLSVWIKHSGTNGQEHIMFSNAGGNDNTGWFQIQISGNQLNLNGYSTTWLTSTQYLRDVSGWYHLVVTADSTAAAANRLKAYINGQEITSWSTNNIGSGTSSNQTWGINMSGTNYIGAEGSGGANAFNGSMSHLNFIDGTVYSPSLFGETDSTTGEWKIKADITGVNYGNNGSSILKNSNSLTDVSGKSNNWSLANGTLTDTKDCPDNVFATLNPLAAPGSSITFSKGNTQIDLDAGGYHAVYSTIGATSGKYYAECLVDAVGSGTSIGIISADTVSNVQETGDGDYMGKEADSIGYVYDGEVFKANSLQQTIATYTNADIISLAFDLDNNTIQFYKNGSSVGSTVSLTANKTYMIGGSGYNGSRQMWNFGNGFFGTTAVTSAGTAGSTPGVFEYDVPSGYEPLTTKGLNA